MGLMSAVGRDSAVDTILSKTGLWGAVKGKVVSGFNEPELLDDLLDHWTSDYHSKVTPHTPVLKDYHSKVTPHPSCLKRNTVDSLYKHTSGTRNSCPAIVECHAKLTSMLIIKLTCTGNSTLGPKNLVYLIVSVLRCACYYMFHMKHAYQSSPL